MEARTKYETYRKLLSMRYLIGSRKQIFWNNNLMNNEHAPDAPQHTRHL